MESAVAIGVGEDVAVSAPRGRVGLVLLLCVLAFVAAPYLDTGMPAAAVLLAMLGSFAIAAWSPVLGVAFLLAATPFAEAIANYLVTGVVRSREFVWIEPMFLGTAAGITARLLARRSATRNAPAAARFYAAVVLCAFSVQLAGYLWRWQSQTYLPLGILWSALSDPSQLSPEHVARATLLYLMGPLWLWLVRNAVDEPERFRTVWRAWLAGALAFNVCAIAMWIGGFGLSGVRLRALFEDPNSYSSYLVLTLFVAWFVARSESRAAARVAAAIVLVSTVCLILLAGSKVGMLTAFGAVTIVVMRAQNSLRRRVVAGVVLSIAWVGFIFAAQYLPSDIGRTSDPSYLLSHAERNRWAVWSATTHAVATHPMAGVGPGLLCRSLSDYYRQGDKSWRPRFENAHDYFLQLGAEIGLFGLFGFLWLIAACLRPAFRDGSSGNQPRYLLMVGALGYLATLLTGHALLLSRQTILFWGFLGVLSAPYEFAAPSRLLTEVSVGSDPTTIDLRGIPLAPGPTALRFVPSPGARRVEKIIGNRDKRSMSVSFLGEPKIFLHTP